MSIWISTYQVCQYIYISIPNMSKYISTYLVCRYKYEYTNYVDIDIDLPSLLTYLIIYTL